MTTLQPGARKKTRRKKVAKLWQRCHLFFNKGGDGGGGGSGSTTTKKEEEEVKTHFQPH